MSRFAKELDTLKKADTVAFGPVGIADAVLPVTQAYFDLADALEPRLRRDLERLVDKATPAGKVYAAALLTRLDPGAGRRAWQRLAADDSAFSTFSGCIMGRATLADYAAGQLASPDSA
jgi:hypothetical protein